MSDNMERDKESLTAKEREKKRMEQELLDMGMYEPDYTYEHMKKILCFISESKNMASIAEENRNVQKEMLHSSNDCTSEIISKANLSQESERQDHVDLTKSIHAHRRSRVSPIPDRASTQCSNSSESMHGIFESRNATHSRKGSVSDDLFDRSQDQSSVRDSCSHSANIYVPSRSKISVLESHNAHTAAEVNMETQSEYTEKLDKWRINPLDACVDENDVPLRQPDRPSVEDREPFRSCKDAHTPETIEKLLLALNLHLKQTAELWHSWHRTTDSNFQWGSPIQVEPGKGSSNKKLLNITTEQNKPACSSKYSLERPNKRKSAISSPSTRQSSSDEDEQTNLITNERKKTRFVETSTRVLRPSTHPQLKDPMSSNFSKQDAHNLLEDETIDSDDPDTRNLQTRFNEEFERAPPSPELISTYPRRIVPPNPRENIKKKKHNVSLSSKSSTHSNEKQSLMTRMPRKSSSLNDDDIFMELEKDNNEKCKTKSVEIKPLPMKGLTSRLKEQFMYLKEIQIEENKKQEAAKEESQRRENEERRRREEFYKTHTEERQQKYKQQEEIERVRTEKSMQWSRRLKSKENRGKSLNPYVQKVSKTLEIEDEDRLLEDTDTCMTEQMEIIDGGLNEVNCPICNESFPIDRIETHAAECEQYSANNDEGNSNTNLQQYNGPATKKNTNYDQILICNVCSQYRTTNGIQYEEHVNICLQKQHRQEPSRSYGSATVEIDNIPTSPIRCYRPISEQTDSEIDYRGQFGSSSKKQIHSNKKRKRL